MSDVEFLLDSVSLNERMQPVKPLPPLAQRVYEVENDLGVNPGKRVLSDDQRRALSSLLDALDGEIHAVRRFVATEQTLAFRMAVQQGRTVLFDAPDPRDRESVAAAIKARSEAKDSLGARFGKYGRDWLYASVGSSERKKSYLIYFAKEHNPEFFKARRRLGQLQTRRAMRLRQFFAKLR